MATAEEHPALAGAGVKFHHDVLRATRNLLLLLRGVELVRVLPPQQWPDYLDVDVVFVGQDRDAPAALRGEAEQVAYRAWLIEIFARWEHQNRLDLHRATEEELGPVGARDLIRPETDVLGDLRHIRNDLLHNRGIANEAASCDVLQWFDEGERIVLGMEHVFDVLNQLGFTDGAHTDSSIAPPITALYLTSPASKTRRPVPEAVSVTKWLDDPGDGSDIRCLVSLVYSNGYRAACAFSTGMMPGNDELDGVLDGLRVEDGKLLIPALGVSRSTASLYQFAHSEQKAEPYREGLPYSEDVPGAMRIAREDGDD